MKKKLAYITSVLVLSMGLSVTAYADIISDAPVEIGAAPMEDSAATVTADTVSDTATGLQSVDMSVLSSLARFRMSFGV